MNVPDGPLAAALVAAGVGVVFCMPPATVELLPNWGGVIESTAPNPPTVPPAINSARFIS